MDTTEKKLGTDPNFKRRIVWFNAIGFLFLHLCYLHGIYRLFKCHPWTNIYSFGLMGLSGLAVTMGAHRMYSHKAFKGTFLVRLFAIIFHTVAGQNCLYIWVRDHRQHHKYSDTDADPHNANRGFFFSHVGWLMSRKHPEVISKGKTIDMSDLEADWLVMLQKEHYKVLYVIFAMGIPVAIPIYLWNESFLNSFFISYFVRYLTMLHFTWCINSVTHFYGMKPYDKDIRPVENIILSWFVLGESWHNYHHAFPYDYKAAEYGWRYSVTTIVIDVLAFFGLVYDLREANPDAVIKRVLTKGDGTHPQLCDKSTDTVFSLRSLTASG